MPDLINIKGNPVRQMLPLLLADKSTGRNIIWATDAYADHGENYSDKNEITVAALTGLDAVLLQPRILKSLEDQQERTRKKAEVMTPVWICNKMNNYLDEQWFGRKDVFNHENEDNSWTVTPGKVDFGKLSWKKYIDSRRLEITCGEAPYIVSRYDTTTGELIVPPLRRIGLLDRKFRVVNENTDAEEEWMKWAIRAVQSSYGYEYQGDNLLIARINVLLSFRDYYFERWNKEPEYADLKRIANIIAWNIWQMDGLKDTVPFGKPYQENFQFVMEGFGDPADETPEAVPCRIYDWRANKSLRFMDCKAEK